MGWMYYLSVVRRSGKREARALLFTPCLCLKESGVGGDLRRLCVVLRPYFAAVQLRQNKTSPGFSPEIQTAVIFPFLIGGSAHFTATSL